MIAPTTTRKLAQKMLSASSTVARSMPRGFYSSSAFDILLTLYVAEDDASYLAIEDLEVPGCLSPSVTQRWVAALVSEQLIDQRAGLLALSCKGYELVSMAIESICAAQRALD